MVSHPDPKTNHDEFILWKFRRANQMKPMVSMYGTKDRESSHNFQIG